jgi:cytochrome c oxidase assembly factor CtaG
MRFVPDNPLGIAAWFVGAVVGHDLLLLPLYSLLDRGPRAVLRHRLGPTGPLPPGPWINHLRAPAVLSALLFLVFAPLILRLPPGFEHITGRPVTPYLMRWLLITAALFVGSAVILAWRVGRARWLTSSSAPGAGRPQP